MSHMKQKRSRTAHRILAILAVAMLAVATPRPSLWAQDASSEQAVMDPDYQPALKRGNKAYNDGDYDAAVQSYTQAIQAAPTQPDPYRNMARAFFWKGDYSASLAYYDIYLVSFPNASDSDQIQRERRLTSDRSTTPWKLPETQRKAMRALEDSIDAGPAYTRGGGGAWKSYQQLLRSGYAQPGLTKLRQRLFKALLTEFDALLVAEPGQPSPAIDLTTWELQKARLEAANKVMDTTTQRDALERRLPIAEAALALQLSRYDEAAERAEVASQRNPDMVFLHWYRVTALLRANKAKEALDVLDALRPIISEKDPRQLDYHRVVRAMILQRLGRHDDAASIYVGIFEGN